MEFKQLESFVEIAKQKSFTKAAEKLYLTQPTLTGHIQTLEEELGIVLFNRSRKKNTLTEAGELFYNHAVNILNMREQARYTLSQYEKKIQGELSIAASTVLQNYLLPELLTRFSAAYPGVNFELRQFDSEEVIEEIISGSMDFGFVGTAAACPELTRLDLGGDELLLIASAQADLTPEDQQFITWQDVCDCKFILREEGSATGGLFLAALQEIGVGLEQIKVVARIESPNTIKQCVRRGLGVAVLSRRAVQEEIDHGLLKAYVFQDLDLSRQFYFLSHKRRVLDPVSRAFRDFVQSHFCEAQ